MRQLNISEDMIAKVIECYEHLEGGFVHIFLRNENKVLLIFDIYNKDTEYFKKKFSLEVNFKNMDQVRGLLD